MVITMNAFAQLKTNQSLLDAIQNKASKKQTPDEIREQRVSFIYGSISFNKSADVTRSRIREVLTEQQGIGS